MKFLVFGPSFDAERSVIQRLESMGAAVLVPQDGKEALAFLQLHNQSLDLAVICREGQGGRGEPGLEVVQAIKGNPLLEDLPFILTTSVWTDAECADHQNSPQGANAYLKEPLEEDRLIEVVQAILGEGEKPLTQDEIYLSDYSGSVGTGGAPEPSLSQYASPTIDPAEVLEIPELNLHSGNELGNVSVEPILSENSSFSEQEVESSAESLSGSSSEVRNDGEARQEMPYLYSDHPMKLAEFGRPTGDAVVPGGAVDSPDLETLKRYLSLREQDVGALSTQLRTAKDQVDSLEKVLIDERGRVVELEHVVDEQKKKLSDFEKEKSETVANLESEISELRFQMKSKADKARLLESRVLEASEEMERLKKRVRSDIRKIRVREKDLENRLDLLKKDSEVLIAARENRIIELKRKVDMLEFNMDLLQDQYAKEKQKATEMKEKLSRAAQAMRVAGGLLQEKDQLPETNTEVLASERKSG